MSCNGLMAPNAHFVVLHITYDICFPLINILKSLHVKAKLSRKYMSCLQSYSDLPTENQVGFILCWVIPRYTFHLFCSMLLLLKSRSNMIKNATIKGWNQGVVMMAKFSSQLRSEVFITTISDATYDDNIKKPDNFHDVNAVITGGTETLFKE